MSVNSCYEAIGRYNALKVSLSNVVGQLNAAHSRISPVPGAILSSYSVNENKTPIVGRVEALDKDIADTANYISKTVIPAIDKAISQKRKEITQLQQEES